MSSVKSDTARRSRAFSAGHRLPWRPHGRPAGAGGATLYGSLRDAHGLEVVLYRALKAFGQIIKSLFILRYLDDLALRQAVEQQLSRVELANRFTRDVAVGSPREFLQAEKEDQEIAEACNRLIKNSIVCWNYLYLEHKLATLRDAGQKLGQVHRWLAEHRRAPARNTPTQVAGRTARHQADAGQTRPSTRLALAGAAGAAARPTPSGVAGVRCSRGDTGRAGPRGRDRGRAGPPVHGARARERHKPEG